MAVIAVDIGGTKMDLSVVHENGQIIPDTRLRINPTPGNPNHALDFLMDYILTYFRQYDIRAAGIGACGMIGGDTGGYFLPKVSNLPNWGNFKLRKNLETLLEGSTGAKTPLSMESDVYSATAAELLARKSPAGADKNPAGLLPFFYLTVSTGVGGEQAISDGDDWKIHRNFLGFAGVGHTQFRGIAINTEPLACGCGEIDCAETYLGGSRMLKRYGLKPEEATPEMIDMVAQNLGELLYQNELSRDSKIIVVGGRIANEWNKKFYFLDKAKFYADTLFRQEWWLPAPTIEASALGEDVGIVGGWAIAMRKITGKWPEYQKLPVPNADYAKTSQPFPKAL